MKKIIKSLQRKAGYISIETVIVSGLLIVLGAWAFVEFQNKGIDVITQGTDLARIPETVQVTAS